MPRHPPHVRDEARRLRAGGESVKQIAARLEVSVAWVSVAVRDIVLTAEQRTALDAHRRGARSVGHLKRSAASRRRRTDAQRHGRALARCAPPDFIAGCMLHWAEGSKNRNVLQLTNADPMMLRYWVDWVERWFSVDRSELVIAVNVHLGNGLSLAEIEAHWLRILDLPGSCLRPSIVNRPSSASKGVRRPLVHGTVRISLNSTEAAQTVYGAIQEYAGFERPEWLDMGTVAAVDPPGG